jgi:hypothetical protein
MSRPDLVGARGLSHSHAMRQGWWWNALGVVGLSLVAGCLDPQPEEYSSDLPVSPADYMLGGQTGSLIPTCGVAPLSASGYAVPRGDAVAVLYGSGCPEALAASRVALTGPDARPVAILLESLDDGVYLVRAAESLEGGEYGLVVSGQSQGTLAVDDEGSALPLQIGALTVTPSVRDCLGDVVFEVELSAEALAHAPLLRWFVSVDGGDWQVWADYGALELTSTPEGSRGELALPRCGPAGCLPEGSHGLELRAELAGESLPSAATRVAFDIQCAASTPADDGCSAAAPARSSGAGFAALLATLTVAVGAALRRARRAGSL